MSTILRPKPRDTDNDLLRKLAGPLAKPRDSNNDLLRKIAGAVYSLGDSSNTILFKIAQAIFGIVPGGENLTGAGSPVGSATPDFVGQAYQDTTAPGAIWRSTGTTSADWTHIGDAPVFDWTPTSEDAYTKFGLFLTTSNLTTVTLLKTAHDSGLNILANTALTSFSAPNLISAGAGAGANANAINISSNSALITLSLPVLVTVGGTASFIVQSNTAMTSLVLSQLATTGGGLTISGNTLLASVALPELLSTAGTFSVGTNAALTSLSIPKLASVTQFNCQSNATLTAISAPLLATSSGGLSMGLTGNTLLASISFPELVTVAGGINAANLANLTTVTLTKYLPTNAKAQNFGGCALNQASVDHILARCVANAAYVSGTVTLSGGTNSTPSAQGLTDKATLIGRGCTVATN